MHVRITALEFRAIRRTLGIGFRQRIAFDFLDALDRVRAMLFFVQVANFVDRRSRGGRGLSTRACISGGFARRSVVDVERVERTILAMCSKSAASAQLLPATRTPSNAINQPKRARAAHSALAPLRAYCPAHGSQRAPLKNNGRRRHYQLFLTSP